MLLLTISLVSFFQANIMTLGKSTECLDRADKVTGDTHHGSDSWGWEANSDLTLRKPREDKALMTA